MKHAAGSADHTIDEEYEELAFQFSHLENLTMRLMDDGTKYLEVIQSMS